MISAPKLVAVQPQPTADEDLWKVKRAAQFLNLSPFTVYRWSGDGRIPCRRLGSRLRFVPAELRLWASLQSGSVSK